MNIPRKLTKNANSTSFLARMLCSRFHACVGALSHDEWLASHICCSGVTLAIHSLFKDKVALT